jgi:2-dehydro-3-deoxygalactonokinase
MAADLSAAHLIAIDWGTSRLRAWLVDANGRVLAGRTSDKGIGALDGGHEAVFGEITSGWPKTVAILAGMIGSRQGWKEAAYVPCPAAVTHLADRLTRWRTADGRDVAIVPGLMAKAPERDGDVIRGEETQLIGLADSEPNFAGLAILPGTHSKWAAIERGTVTTFQTFISGELFALLAHQSFLRHSVAEGIADLAAVPDFTLAVRRMVRERLPFPAALFSVRTRVLLADVSREANLAYLSGLVIGGEIAAAEDAGLLTAGTPVRIVASPALANAYRTALAVAGVTAEARDGGTLVLDGLMHIARATGWMKDKTR